MSDSLPSRADFAAEFQHQWAATCDRWSKTVESAVESGHILLRAKRTLPTRTFETFIKSDLPVSVRKAQKLMRIAGSRSLSDASNWTHLPPSWTTLYMLAELKEDVLVQAFRDSKITPEMKGEDVRQLAGKVMPAKTGPRMREMVIFKAGWTTRDLVNALRAASDAKQPCVRLRLARRTAEDVFDALNDEHQKAMRLAVDENDPATLAMLRGIIEDTARDEIRQYADHVAKQESVAPAAEPGPIADPEMLDDVFA